MPFDGVEKDWEPTPPPRRRWYTVVPAGQKKRRKRWQVDTFDGGEWWPLFAFYAPTMRDASAVAAWAMRQAYP